jgi:hypothetical protein
LRHDFVKNGRSEFEIALVAKAIKVLYATSEGHDAQSGESPCEIRGLYNRREKRTERYDEATRNHGYHKLKQVRCILELLSFASHRLYDLLTETHAAGKLKECDDHAKGRREAYIGFT